MKKILMVILSLALIASVATQIQAQPRKAILDDGPLVYYTFEETGGTIAADSSGNGNSGTYVNALLGEVGFFGNGVTLEAEAGAYVIVPDLETCTIDYTIEFVITAFDAAAAGCCTSLYSTDACSNGVCTHLNYLGGEGGGTEIAGEGAFIGTGSAIPAPGTIEDPVHIAIVVDGTNMTGAIYVNGVAAEAEVDVSGDTCDSFTLAAIGAWLAEGGTPDRFFAGALDDFAIFDKALSEERIIAHATDLTEGVLAITVDQSATTDIIEAHPTVPTSTTFSVVLSAGDPNVPIQLIVDPNNGDGDGSEQDINLGLGAAMPITLTFTPLNWDMPQTVTVTAENDDDPEPCLEIADITIKSIDPNSSIANPAYISAASQASVTVVDNETGCVFVDTGDGVEINEIDPNGTIDTFTYVLNRQPAGGDNIITLTETTGLATIEPNTLTFSSTTWQIPQTVSIKANQDDEFISEMDPMVTGQSSGDLSPLDPNAFNPVPAVNASLIEDECGELGFLPNDFNQDCSINMLDFSLFSVDWGNCSEPDVSNCP